MLENVASTLESALRFKIVYPGLERFVRHRSVNRAWLKETCEQNNRIWYGDSEKPIRIERPNHPTLKEAFDPYPMNFTLDRPFVCDLRDCYLLDSNGTALTNNNKLILETINWGLREFIGAELFRDSRNEFIKHTFDVFRGSEEKREKTVFPIICTDSSFYHWMMECLPKLRMLEIYQKNTGIEPKLLVETDPPSFVRQTLQVAGYEPSDMTEIGDLVGTTVNNLVISTQRPHLLTIINPKLSPYSPSYCDIQWVRNRMRSNTDIQSDVEDWPTRIYISRQNASRGRKVTNYSEFISELEERSFVPFELENLPFDDQVKLFSNAEIIMGPIGAGLVNMIFSDNPLVIELFPKTMLLPERKLPPTFYFLSQIMQHEYEPILIEGKGNNLVVDIDLFTEKLDRILQ